LRETLSISDVLLCLHTSPSRLEW